MPMLAGVCCDMHANGCVYWVVDDEDEPVEYLLALDTHTKAFSTIDVLRGLRTRYQGNMRVVRTTDNAGLRMVALDGTMLGFWRLDRSKDSSGRWALVQMQPLEGVYGAKELFAEGDGRRVKIMDAGEGYVFFKHWGSEWVFALKLDVMVLLKFEHTKFYYGPALPYRMGLHPTFLALD